MAHPFYIRDVPWAIQEVDGGSAMETKICKCIICEKEVRVSKFMTPSKVRCDECKKRQEEQRKSFGGPSRGPRIDGQPNKALRKLGCPYHPDQAMKIIGVIKGEWGDIVSLQCRVPGCWCVVQISEQQQGPLRTKASGLGLEPDDIIGKFEEGS